jgi:hypothetical protein
MAPRIMYKDKVYFMQISCDVYSGLIVHVTYQKGLIVHVVIKKKKKKVVHILLLVLTKENSKLFNSFFFFLTIDTCTH